MFGFRFSARFSLDPAPETSPRSAYPPSDHPVEHVLVDDPLEDHRPPHFAGAIHGESSVERVGVAADELRVCIVRKPEHALNGLANLLRLHGAHDVDRRQVAPVAHRLTDFGETEDHAEHDRRRRCDVQRHARIHERSMRRRAGYCTPDRDACASMTPASPPRREVDHKVGGRAPAASPQKGVAGRPPASNQKTPYAG